MKWWERRKQCNSKEDENSLCVKHRKDLELAESILGSQDLCGTCCLTAWTAFDFDELRSWQSVIGLYEHNSCHFGRDFDK